MIKSQTRIKLYDNHGNMLWVSMTLNKVISREWMWSFNCKCSVWREGEEKQLFNSFSKVGNDII